VLPKQLQFIQSEAREVGYSGAWRAGKSRALCYKIAAKAQIPGNLCVLCRATLTSLRETTLRALLEPEGDLPPVLPKGSYTHNQTKHLVDIHGGGEILYFGFDRSKAVKGLTAGTIGIDEAVEITADQYEWLMGRLTHKADHNHQLCWATNPGSPSHFLYKRFYKDKEPTRELIHTTAYDNVFLPQDYLDYLDTLTGLYRDRYVLGRWVAFEGMVYDNWNRDHHLVHREEFWKWLLVTVDEGYENPASAGLWGIDSDDRMHRLKSFYKRHVLQSEFVRFLVDFGTEVKDAHGKELERRFVCDPSAAGLIAAMEAAGLTVEKADNDVMAGIQEMRDRLAVRGDGRPGMTIEPDGEDNEHVVEEIESYHFDKDERPAKGLDHTMDESRYGCMYMKQFRSPQLFSLAFEATDRKRPEGCSERKRELDGRTGTERDDLREMAIEAGYVRPTCNLPGGLIMALVCSQKRPCNGCNDAERCDRLQKAEEGRREAILSREGAWR
jgi:PBSX family phage terminase large subunit